MKYCIVNVRVGYVIHTRNRKHRSKANFKIEKGFLEEIAPFKDLKDELIGACQVYSRKVCPGLWEQQVERPRGVKKKKLLTFWRKEKKCCARNRECQGEVQDES